MKSFVALQALLVSLVFLFERKATALRFTSFLGRTTSRLAANPISATGSVVEIQKERDELLEIALKSFKDSPSGVFITDPSAKDALKKAVLRLESIATAPTNPEQLKGRWKLICTTNLAGLPAFDNMQSLFKPLQEKFTPLQDSLRKNVKVIQRIWDTNDATNTTNDDVFFNRVDNIIDINTSDDLIAPFLNPLQVTKSKLTLAHKVEANSYPVLRTKIALQSIILTVAGKSQLLDVNGSDVLGINVPLGDLLNFGSFDTTYVDDVLRVSRSTLPYLDQLRVFMKIAHEEEKDEPNEAPQTSTQDYLDSLSS